MRTIAVTKITKDEAINHSRREYNPSAWKRNIELYSKDECSFYTNGENVYAIYIADNIRFCQEISYAMCLSGGGLKMGVFNDDAIFFVDAPSVENNKYNRQIMKKQTKKLNQIFYY